MADQKPGLVKTKIPIPLTNGIDTKTDDKQLPVGTLQSANNITFESPGKLIKRNGYKSLSTATTDSATILTFGLDKLNIKSIMPRDKELVSATSESLYSYSKTLDKWIRKGPISDVQASSFPVYRGTFSATTATSLFLGNYKIVAAVVNNILGYTVIDPDGNSTNHQVFITAVQEPIVVGNGSTIATKVRLAHIGNTVFVFYENAGNITYTTFNLSDPAIFTTPVDVVTDLNTTGRIFDVLSIGDGVVVAYKQSGNQLSYFKIYSDLSLSSIVNQSITGITNIDLASNGMGGIMMSVCASTVLKFLVVRENLGSLLIAISTIDTQSPAITHATSLFIGGEYIIYYEVTASNTWDYYIKSNTVTTAAVVGTPVVFARSVGLAGKAFPINISSTVVFPFVPAIHVSALQPTNYLLDRKGTVVSTINDGVAGTFVGADDPLPQTSFIDQDTVFLTSLFTSNLVSSNGTFASVKGVNSTVFSFNLANPNQAGTLASTLHAANGVLTMYDGARVVEHGYFLYPENITNSINAAAGSVGAGTYLYYVVYSWTDNLGQIHRSAPSIALSVTNSGSTNTNTLTIPTLRLTTKTAIIEVYRTIASGTIAYKLTSNSSPLYNSTTTDTVTYADSVADASIISNEPLYTTGGVLENIVAPQASLCEVYNNRIYLAGLEDPNKIVLSKERKEGYPVEFNDTLYRLINPYGGNIMAIKTMDDKFIVFKETAIYYFAGNGPNNLGQSDDYTDAFMISSDVGCINRNSVVIAPQGLFFQSSKGIYLLSRSLQVTYVGAPVEAFNNLTITSAKTVQTKNTVRFATIEGTTLVYNYYLEKWSTFSNMPSYDAEVIYGVYYYLRTNGAIYQETDSFDDNGTEIPLSLTTGWISFAGVQGLQRIYRMLILGSFNSRHTLKVSIAYDYVDAWVEEAIVNSSTFIDDSTFGSDATFGSSATFASNNLYQLRINFTKQKCKAIKIKIEDISAVNGQSLSLSNLLFYVGAKQSPGHLGSSNISSTN